MVGCFLLNIIKKQWRVLNCRKPFAILNMCVNQVLALTEHWKSQEELGANKINGFKLVACFCEKGWYWVVAFYSANNVVSKTKTDINGIAELFSFERIAVDISSNNFSWTVVNIYNTPTSNINLFMSKLNEVFICK